VTWPENWRELVTGAVCRFCEEGRPAENRIGLRIQAGAVSDASWPGGPWCADTPWSSGAAAT
jgi:hypothetical protein